MVAPEPPYLLTASGVVIGSCTVRFVDQAARVVAGTFAPTIAYARWRPLVEEHARLRQLHDPVRIRLHADALAAMHLGLTGPDGKALDGVSVTLDDDGSRQQQPRFTVAFDDQAAMSAMASHGRRPPWRLDHPLAGQP